MNSGIAPIFLAGALLSLDVKRRFGIMCLTHICPEKANSGETHHIDAENSAKLVKGIERRKGPSLCIDDVFQFEAQ